MFRNEFSRCFFKSKNYWLDFLSSKIYDLIFLVGVASISKEIDFTKFLPIYVFSATILLGNEELEEEIRKLQLDKLVESARGVIQTYFYRLPVFFLLTTAVFFISMGLAGKFESLLNTLTPAYAVQYLLSLIIAVIIYYGMLKVTLRYQRVQVLLTFIYTVIVLFVGLD
ncbi:MAG: hypothetical protein LBV19_06635 [Streptococcaceae bacterium]|jgi:hypothetical protein|nr:hypothetical protein [Streptococcaceae bacterium]